MAMIGTYKRQQTEESTMVKGTHKQMVVVRTHDSAYYEEAYFVLREGRGKNGQGESTMMAEANRILHESLLMPQPRARARLSPRACFWLGTWAGASVSAAAFLLLLLLL
jgi:hypothetical protein